MQNHKAYYKEVSKLKKEKEMKKAKKDEKIETKGKKEKETKSFLFLLQAA